MTDNTLKIIKDELARIDEARAKATELDTISIDELEEVLDDHGYFSCSENNRECAEFIALAANEITSLTKALSVAVEILNGVSLFKDANRNIYDCAESMSVDAEFGLKDIANILSGGKDGNL